MRKLFIIVLAIFAAGICAAQTTFEEISATPWTAGGLYYPYPVTESANTKAPKGFKPFYISHYGRHGSRYLVGDEQYSTPLNTLKKAAEANALTDAGKDLLGKLEIIWEDARGRSGELTPLGAKQHHDIAQRMYRAYPEVFVGEPVITAKSTVIMRCAHSMAAFCEGLKELNPNLVIPRESAQRFMYYMANTTPQANKYNHEIADPLIAKFEAEVTHPERLMNELFTDQEYVAQNINASDLMLNLFRVAIDAPNTPVGDMLPDLFTPEERFDLWRAYNYRYYNHMSNPAAAKGAVLDNARPLLRNIVDSANSMIASDNNGADLRFGHDSCIVPLVGLMQLDGCFGSTDDPATLHAYYADYKISPMAANLQMIFFKNKKGEVIVKFMLNEREIGLPIESMSGPFYDWKKVNEFFEGILAEK